MLSVARTGGWLSSEPLPDEGSVCPMLPSEEASDPLQELQKLEEALELFQAEGEPGAAEGFWSDNEELEFRSSGSE